MGTVLGFYSQLKKQNEGKKKLSFFWIVFKHRAETDCLTLAKRALHKNL